MSKSNEVKDPNAFDMANTKAVSELTGLDTAFKKAFRKAFRIVEQTRTYDGGQMDLFPKELVKESSLFLTKVETNE